MLVALIIFIYLAIGGILTSGAIMYAHERIFDRSFKKMLNEFESELVKYLFGVWVGSLLIIGWLPFVVFVLICYIKD